MFTRKKLFKSLLFTLIYWFSFSSVSAHEDTLSTTVSKENVTETSVEKEHDHTDKPFDPTVVIFEHISDSHQWHLWGDHDHAVSIPLPIILWTDKGMDIFSSSKVAHHNEIYQGKNYSYKLEEEHLKAVDPVTGEIDEDSSAKIKDFSITKNVAQMFVSLIVLIWIFTRVAKAYQTTGVESAPSGLQSFMETLIMFVRDDIAKPNISHNHEKFVPFLLTIFFFILINNIFGMIPIGANLTGNIAFTFVMGTITFVVTQFSANKSYWSHIFLPPVPAWLYPIMIPVEVIGIFSKPFALIVRLFANMTAGHIIIISLVSLIFIFKTVAMSVVSVPF
ncbi:MAG: F0F1 ATP synthase subunit A, partial [Bacteroidia bacterium]|nr:F0F1 ATP synthase subunit A [Bacteroidia bacterium]